MSRNMKPKFWVSSIYHQLPPGAVVYEDSIKDKNGIERGPGFVFYLSAIPAEVNFIGRRLIGNHIIKIKKGGEWERKSHLLKNGTTIDGFTRLKKEPQESNQAPLVERVEPEKERVEPEKERVEPEPETERVEIIFPDRPIDLSTGSEEEEDERGEEYEKEPRQSNYDRDRQKRLQYYGIQMEDNDPDLEDLLDLPDLPDLPDSPELPSTDIHSEIPCFDLMEEEPSIPSITELPSITETLLSNTGLFNSRQELTEALQLKLLGRHKYRLNQRAKTNAKNMKIETFKELIDMNKQLIQIKLQGMGEPFVNKNYIEFVNYLVNEIKNIPNDGIDKELELSKITNAEKNRQLNEYSIIHFRKIENKSYVKKI